MILIDQKSIPMEFQAAVRRIKFRLLSCYFQRHVVRGLGKIPVDT